jgi:hypothetical protein
MNIEIIPTCEMTKLSVWDERDDEDCYHIYFEEYTEIEFFIHNKNNCMFDLRNTEFVLSHSNFINFTDNDSCVNTVKLPTNISSTRFCVQDTLFPDDCIQMKVKIGVDLMKMDGFEAHCVLKILSDAGVSDIPFKFRFCVDSEKLAELSSQHPNASKSDEIRKIEAAIKGVDKRSSVIYSSKR